MPAEIPQLPDSRSTGRLRPASPVGLFRCVPLDSNTLAICIADVCGKGMPAAMIMSKPAGGRPIARLGDESSRSLRPSKPADVPQHRVTVHHVFLCCDGVRAEADQYCNADTIPRFWLRGIHCQTGLRRNRAWRSENGNYQQQTIGLTSADRLVMYNDGITGRRNAAGDEFGKTSLLM